MNPLLLGILKQTPELILIAKKLAEHVKGGKKTAGITERVAALEKNEVQQADLIKEMARQLNDMGSLMRILNRRIAVCLACSMAALALALVALLNLHAR